MGRRLGGLLDRWFGRGQSEPGKQPNGGGLSDLAVEDNPRESRRGIARDPASRIETLRWANSDGTEATAVVAVKDDSDLGVRLDAPAELAVGATVWLTFDGDAEKCVVRHCERQGDAYAVGLYRVRDERRREDREVVQGKANLFWGGGGSDVCLIEVDVRDVSTGGMQVVASRSIPLHTPVRVAGQDYACLGVTCYCRSEGQRFAVGIQFTQDPYYIEGAEYDG